MRICLTDAGKRFNRDWVFRHVDLTLTADRVYALTGPNGSGKSTLLQLMGGVIDPSEGSVAYHPGTRGGSGSEPSRLTAFCAPYLELIEEMTGGEFLHFHRGFKPFRNGLTVAEALAEVDLSRAEGKVVRYYSSGMKQRLKLAQSVLSDTPVLLLDEPCTNLDAKGMGMYRDLLSRHSKGRIVVIASNDEAEYDFCDEVLGMDDWKTASKGGTTRG